jgi:hypothetical protein
MKKYGITELSLSMKLVKVLITVLISLAASFTISCRDQNDDGRNDRVIYFYIKGYLINATTGKNVNGMKVLLKSGDTNKLSSADSTSLNGTYLVYQSYSTDPHMPRLSDSHIIAANPDFFGDTLISKYSNDTLKLNIIVKPVGKIILDFHNLNGVNKVILSTIDNVLLNGYIRNSSVIEFEPKNSDTVFTLPAYPDRQNAFYCWFNKYTPGAHDFDSIFYIKSGDSVQFTINH